jgi:hypothetical protein
MQESGRRSIDELKSEHRLGEQPDALTILEALATDLPGRWFVDEDGYAPKLVYYHRTDKPLSFCIEAHCAPAKTESEQSESEELDGWGFGFRTELILILGRGQKRSSQTITTAGAMNFDDALEPLRNELRDIGDSLKGAADWF